MKKLDRFILFSFIGPFLMILVVVIFILMLHFLWLYIDELVGKGLGLKIILEFLMWGSCTILPLALPLSTLLASMMTLGQMGENNELLAMKSAGISIFRVMTPLIIASVGISIGTFFALNNLVPLSYNEIYTLRDDIGKTKEEIKVPSGTFYDGIDGYILRVEDTDDKTGKMHGVMVYDHSANKGNTFLTLADSAQMKMSKQKDYLTFTLYHGTNYQETNTKRYRDTTLQLQRIHFNRQDLVIPLTNYSFEKSDEARYGDQVKAMKLSKLRNDSDSLNKLLDSTKVMHWGPLTSPTFLAKRSQLDTSVHSGITRPTDLPEGFLTWKSPAKHRDAVGRAKESAMQMAMNIENFNRAAYEYNFILARADVEKFKRFAQALACLILFFIGAPLGALIRKGGLGTSAIVSILFFVLYWVVDISGTKLAKDGATTAFIGAFISAWVLGPIGIFLTWKAVNDASLFNTDNIGTWWRKIKSKFMGFFKKTRIVYMGTPEFAVAPLDALLQKKYHVVGVVTVPDKPSGRGLKMNQSAVKKYAVEKGLPVLQPEKLRDPAFLEALKAFKADLFVVVGFRMLPDVVWTMPPLGTFNLHAALLPQYRGAAPINWAVINGEKMTGVTTFMIDKDIDTGGIILRQECRISDTDTAGDVHDRLMALGADLVVQTVEGIIQKNVETRVQRSFIQGSEVLKPAPKLTRELCHIDWNRPSIQIYNLIRGLSPYPAAFTELIPCTSLVASEQVYCSSSQNNMENAHQSSIPAPEAIQLKIYFGEVAGAKYPELMERVKAEKPAPGTVLSDGKTYLAIATADGALALTDVQLSGKKRMDVKAFLLGWRNPESYKAI